MRKSSKRQGSNIKLLPKFLLSAKTLTRTLNLKTRCLELNFYFLAFRPKLFKGVVLALFFGENVHNDVKRIDNAPAAVRLVLNAHLPGGNDFVNRLFEFNAKRTQMRVRRSRRNHVVIRDRRFFAEVNHLNRRRLLFFERGNATLHQAEPGRRIFGGNGNLRFFRASFFRRGGLLRRSRFFRSGSRFFGRRLSGRSSTARGSFCRLRFGGRGRFFRCGRTLRRRFGGRRFFRNRHDGKVYFPK